MRKSRKNAPSQSPVFKPGDRVMTESGSGTIAREVPNLFLLRPGKMFSVVMDSGEEVDTHEDDIKAII